MKLPLFYGSLMAVVSALITYGLFFAGYHDTPEKMQSTQWVGGVAGTIVAVVCVALAMRDRRAQFPTDQNWGYGSALGTGVLTSLWGVLIGSVLTYVYFAIINPQFSDTVYQAQVLKLEQQGMSSSQIEAASGMMKKFTTPIVMTFFQALIGFVWCVLIALIVAIFFRRRELPVESVETAAPPPLA